jgi:hypothetical protein
MKCSIKKKEIILKLLTSLYSIRRGIKFKKDQTSYDDLLGALRLALKGFEFK